MADIYWGLTVIGSLGLGAFCLTLWISRKLPRYAADLLALLVVVAIFAYIRFVWYNTRLVTLLPFSNLVVLGNWFPLAAGALGGLAWQRMPGRIFRKSLFVGALASTSAYSLICPLLGETPNCISVWSSGICVQSTSRTCTPACAATLLHSHGIIANEREMAELCLTREGTTWMGLYRALKLKTAGTPWDVEVIACDASELLRKGDTPMILSVGLPAAPSGRHQIAMSELGWKPGIGHSVVMIRHKDRGRIVVADPTPGFGQEVWNRDEVEFLYRGTAMRLVKRS